MGVFDRLTRGYFAAPEQRLHQASIVMDTMGGVTESAHDFLSFAHEGYAGNGPVFTLVSFKATALGQTRVAWRNIETGDPVARPLPRQLTDPWPQASMSDLFANMSVHASLAGTAFVRRAGDNLYLLRPDWVDTVIPIRDDGTWFLEGFVYWPQGRHKGEPLLLGADEVRVYAPNPDPMSHVRGQSWLGPVAREADADTLMSRHKIKFFQNAATPNMALVVERELSPEQREMLTDQFQSRFSGWGNAYKTVLLEGGADLKVVGSDFEQMAFTNVQAAGETRLASAANVPPIAVGFVQGIQSATYSNYAQAMRRFNDLSWAPEAHKALDTIKPLLDPVPGLELVVDTRHVPFLQQDAKDEAEILKEQATTIESYIRSGYTADSAVSAVVTGDPTKLVHTGLFSVQLQPPMPDGPSTIDTGSESA